MKWLKIIGRELWFCLTLLSGWVDERTIKDVDQEQLGFFLLPIAIIASLFLLVVLTIIFVTFRIG